MQSTSLKEIFFSLKTKIKNFNKSYGRIFWVLIFIILFFILIYIYENIFSSQDLQITFFDIGQGDAALIKTPGRENILIDAGPNNLILKKLEDSLSIFDRNIDLAILSHPDADHVAGYISIFQNYKVKNILENELLNYNHLSVDVMIHSVTDFIPIIEKYASKIEILFCNINEYNIIKKYVKRIRV
jgi:competence protein ComEC